MDTGVVGAESLGLLRTEAIEALAPPPSMSPAAYIAPFMPSSARPPDASREFQLRQIGAPDSDDGDMDLFDQECPEINYRFLVPTRVFLVWTTIRHSRQGCWRSTFRRLVSHFSGGLSHIELAFEFHNGKVVSVSSYTGECVQAFFKNLTNGAYNQVDGEWRYKELAFDETQRHRAWQFSRRQLERPYNTAGLWAFVSCREYFCNCALCSLRPFLTCCFASSYDGSAWMCSQLIVATLQYAFQHHPTIAAQLAPLRAHELNPMDTKLLIERLGLLAFEGQVNVMGDALALLRSWNDKQDGARHQHGQ